MVLRAARWTPGNLKGTEMGEANYDMDEEQHPTTSEPEQAIDYDTDQVDVRDESAEAEPLDDGDPGDEARLLDNADLDNVLDEFVDMVNGRDLDGLGDLMAPDARSDFLGGTERESVVDGFNDLFLRNPNLLATRGDLGSEPIVALWLFDFERDHFDLSGYATLDVDDSADALITDITFVDDIPETEDLVVETPDRAELPEWEDWTEIDEG